MASTTAVTRAEALDLVRMSALHSPTLMVGTPTGLADLDSAEDMVERGDRFSLAKHQGADALLIFQTGNGNRTLLLHPAVAGGMYLARIARAEGLESDPF
jgi:hypothetical protein